MEHLLKIKFCTVPKSLTITRAFVTSIAIGFAHTMTPTRDTQTNRRISDLTARPVKALRTQATRGIVFPAQTSPSIQASAGEVSLFALLALVALEANASVAAANVRDADALEAAGDVLAG